MELNASQIFILLRDNGITGVDLNPDMLIINLKGDKRIKISTTPTWGYLEVVGLKTVEQSLSQDDI